MSATVRVRLMRSLVRLELSVFPLAQSHTRWNRILACARRDVVYFVNAWTRLAMALTAPGRVPCPLQTPGGIALCFVASITLTCGFLQRG
jgi:hypothetical protein